MEDLLKDKSYLIELDSRLGIIIDRDGNEATPLYTDDDSITVYEVHLPSGLGTGNEFVVNNQQTNPNPQTEVIAGVRSTFLQFKIKSSQDLRQSNFYFNKFGSLDTMTNNGGGTPANNARVIDTLIKITGTRTGYTLDVPVRFVKLVA